MRTRLMIATATAAALLAGAALAQPAPATGSNFSQPAAGSDTAVNPPLASDKLPAGDATRSAPANPPSDAATVAPAAGAPAERASTTDLISNGPVPDTKENRAKYGAPLSNAGRMTKPAGN